MEIIWLNFALKFVAIKITESSCIKQENESFEHLEWLKYGKIQLLFRGFIWWNAFSWTRLDRKSLLRISVRIIISGKNTKKWKC